MNLKLIEKSIKITKKLIHLPKGKNKHFTFIFHKNKLIGCGYNNYNKTHTLANLLGYTFARQHSEVMALIFAKPSKIDFKECVLINTRINTLGGFGYCKPCATCSSWIRKMNFRDIIYIDRKGQFKSLGEE